MKLADKFINDLNYDWANQPFSSKYKCFFEGNKLSDDFIKKCDPQSIDKIKEFFIAFACLDSLGSILNRELFDSTIQRSIYIIEKLGDPQIIDKIEEISEELRGQVNLGSIFIQFKGLSDSQVKNTLKTYKLKKKPNCDAILILNKSLIPINFA